MSEQLRLGDWAAPDDEAVPQTGRPAPLTPEQREARTLAETAKIRERWYGSFGVSAPAIGDKAAEAEARRRVAEIIHARSIAVAGPPRTASAEVDMEPLRRRG